MSTTTDKRRALGRGLETLLPAARAVAAAPAPAHEGELVREIPVEHIERNPYQTRSKVDEAALEEMAASIRTAGVLQPVVVRHIDGHRYQLIAGERRWLASQRAGKATVPAIVKQVSNEQAMEMTIIENLQREDLNAMEQARAFERLSSEFGLTQEQIAQRTGKDRASVTNFLRLLRLPEEVQQYIENGVLSFGHAKVLLMLQDLPEQILALARRVLKDGLSVRQTEHFAYLVLNPGYERAAPPKPERMVDPNVRAAERQLQEALGVKVLIRDRKGRGKIVLHYANLEDFDRILEVLGK